MAIESFEFGALMRQLTGRIYVYPFQLCDVWHFVLRAKLHLHPRYRFEPLPDHNPDW